MGLVLNARAEPRRGGGCPKELWAPQKLCNARLLLSGWPGPRRAPSSHVRLVKEAEDKGEVLSLPHLKMSPSIF